MVLITNFIRFIFVSLINGYQKYLSPYKGYSCAHRILHQGESCSQYVKRSLLQQDLQTAIKLSQQRFVDCSKAAQVLSHQRSPYSPINKSSNQPRFYHPISRRIFILVILPSLFTFGLISPALAGRIPNRGFQKAGQCFGEAGMDEDGRDGEYGDPNMFYGLCCLSLIGAGILTEER
ncbi:MAG: membrane protein insertion efficiency factor YidD [Cylindrospermopsis raciborskii PAMP2012]|uniref:membrane protein insertion efficiency factor YidD n=1 Tax=Cylindrospermopsis raciborskii TaxID=77022 RepID=UPI000C1C3F17|nr:membrane protein insertion efficiency factor YidD [Cylindrospermopsis raciborskii]MCZ2202268.1 membrane protein insertion efficiency factor YidD [Cylindrospermopsis raciborskii PAMP2012]